MKVSYDQNMALESDIFEDSDQKLSEKFPKGERSRMWLIEHYPDDETQKGCLDNVSDLSNCNFAYICHDRDTKEMQEAEIAEMIRNLKELGIDCPEDVVGNVRALKRHYHIFLNFNNARTREQVCFSLNIPFNLCVRVKDEKRWLRYLLHLDHPSKHQYKEFEIVSNYSWKLKALACENEEAMLFDILNYIESIEGTIYWSDLYKWVLKKGYYSAYRRNYQILRDIVRENNNPLMG